MFISCTGDTGQGVRAWMKQVLSQDLAFQHIKVIYPTAPARYCPTYFKPRTKFLYSFDRFMVLKMHS